MDTKEETKKVLLTEPIKKLVGWILASLSPFLLALIPQIRNSVQASVSYSLLLVLTSVTITVLLASGGYIYHLRKEVDRLKEQAESNPTPRFGVYWDKELNPLCPACKKLLALSTRKVFQWSGGPPAKPILDCLYCDKPVRLYDDSGKELMLADAKSLLSKDAT